MATSSSSNPQEQRPLSFFKVIRYPSDPHLPLPKAFVRRHFAQIPKNPKLVTETGAHSWQLEFVKIGDDYCFANGWEKLAKDVDLCIRDIVMFWLVDSFTFQVLFLNANGCEKDLPGGGCADGVKDVGNDDGMTDMDLSFEKVFRKKTYKYHMTLPKKFVRAAGLERKQSVTLKDHEGKEWRMAIVTERSPRTKYSISRGWLNFRRYHRLLDGDLCKFTFDKKEGVIILTQILRTKRPINQETPMKEVNRNRNVKIEDDWSPIRKPGGGGDVKVKVECESDGEMEVVNRQRGMPPSKSCGNLKSGDGSSPEMAGKRKRGIDGGGVEVNTEPLMERAFRSKHVVYF